VSKDLISIAQNWADHDPDENTKQQILNLIKNNDLGKLGS